MGMMHLDYLSQVLGYHTNIYYILPGCTHEGKEPAATLYLLHGGAGNGMDWIRYTAIERYADKYNIAVVMPEVDGSCFYADMKHGYKYFTYLTEEVPAIAEGLLPVNKEPEKRLVAGLSMGGYGAFKWAFNCPDFFKAAANLSGISFVMDIFGGEKAFAQKDAYDKRGVVALAWGSLQELQGSMSDSKEWIDKSVREGVKLPKLFAAIGTEDYSYGLSKDYLAYCKEQGVEVHYEEMPGQHEWIVWDTMIDRFIAWAMEG